MHARCVNQPSLSDEQTLYRASREGVVYAAGRVAEKPILGTHLTRQKVRLCVSEYILHIKIKGDVECMHDVLTNQVCLMNKHCTCLVEKGLSTQPAELQRNLSLL